MFWTRIACMLGMPLLLVGCLLTPGTFTAQIDIRADRSFTFAYQGEVIAVDPSEQMGKDMAGEVPSAKATVKLTPDKNATAERELKRRAVAEALLKERGYRTVQYLGDGRYRIDYRIAGRLDHGFVYPFNTDAEAVFPFVAVEVRADNAVRLLAPGFANSASKSTFANPMDQGNKALDGTLTLSTDAEIVMHNSEDGTKPAPTGKSLSWRVTPLTKTPPTAVLKLNP